MKYPVEYPEITEKRFNSLFFIDLESTGFDYWRNEILTLYVIVADYHSLKIREEKLFKFQIENAKNWGREAERVHGISLSQALYFPPKKEASEELLSLLEKYSFNGPQVLVCHAFDKFRKGDLFDSSMLTWHMEKLGLRFRYQRSVSHHQSTATYFLEAKAKGYYTPALFNNQDEEKGVSLSVLCKAFKIPLKHHDPKSDAHACYQLYKIARSFGSGKEINV